MSRKKNLAMSPRDRWIAFGVIAGILVVGGLLAWTGVFIPRAGTDRASGSIPGVHNPESLASAPRLDGYPAPNHALGPQDLKPETALALPEAVRRSLRWSLGWTDRRDGIQVRLLLFDGPGAARESLGSQRADEPLPGVGERALFRGADRVVFVRGAALGVVTGPLGAPREALLEAAQKLDASLSRTFPDTD